jgi:regulator of RNase E activity RraA
MKSKLILSALFACGFVCHGQVFSLTREQLIELTANNPFDRFPDGRPKVPDELLKKFDDISAEEIWAVLPGKKFPNQYEGNFQILHPEKRLVGRAVTAQFMPTRPDIAEVGEKNAKASGVRNTHQRVIDMLQTNDVAVFDLFGKEEGGTVTGDNLAMAIYSATKRGFVVDGSIRDLDGIFDIPMGLYYRHVHPTPIGNVTVTGVNIPVRIGGTTVLPGDVVFGDREGVYFVPPALVKEVLDKAEVTHIHDEWTKMKFETGKYKSSEIYPRPHDPALLKEYQDYLEKRMKEKGLTMPKETSR